MLEVNDHILGRATMKPEVNYLASPITGGGIQVSHLPQLFISAHRNVLTPRKRLLSPSKTSEGV